MILTVFVVLVIGESGDYGKSGNFGESGNSCENNDFDEFGDSG